MPKAALMYKLVWNY